MDFKKELVKNIFFKGVNVLLSFIVTVMMVRCLGTEGNGTYSLFIANTAIIALVISFSFNSGINYYIAKNEFSQSAVFNTIIIVLAVQFFLILILEKIFHSLFGFSFYVETNFKGLTWWGSLYLIAILLNGYLAAFFTGNKWFDNFNYLTVIANFLFVLVFGYLVYKKNPQNFSNTILVLKIYISLIAFQALLYLLVLLKKIQFKLDFRILKLPQIRKIFTYSGIAFFCNFFQFLAYRMDYWFIDFFQNKNELGLYALSSKLSQLLWMLPITIAAVIIPFTVTDSGKLKQNVKIILRLLFNAYIILGIILLILSPIFIPLVFSDSFTGSVIPFLILLPGVIIFSINTILAAYFAGINRLDINLKLSFMCFLIIFAGDLLMVPYLGIKGAAFASSIGYAFSGIVSLIIFSKQSRFSIRELLLFQKEDIRTLKKNLLQIEK